MDDSQPGDDDDDDDDCLLYYYNLHIPLPLIYSLLFCYTNLEWKPTWYWEMQVRRKIALDGDRRSML
jgi:hypothetical protein